MADGINSTLEKSGSNAATGNLDIGSNRITLVADGTAKTDVATVNQIQSNGPAFQATDTGTANTYVIALTPAITAYAAGQEFTFKAGAASTTASTLNVNTLGTKALKKRNDQDIAAGDIEAGSIVTAVYDGTSFQVTSQLASDNAATADALSTARTIASSGDVVWSVSFDGSAAVTSGAVIQASSVDGSMIALGSDASGDVMYYSGSAWARLAKGSDDEVLTLASGLPSWAAAASGGATGIVSVTYNVATASGSLAVTGFGFQPISVILHGIVGAVDNVWNYGIAKDGVTNAHSHFGRGSTAPDQADNHTVIWRMQIDSSNYVDATVSSWDADGLTFGITKVGSPTGYAKLLMTGFKS